MEIIMIKYTINFNTLLPFGFNHHWLEKALDKAWARAARVQIYGMPNQSDNGEFRLDDNWQIIKKNQK